MPQPAAPEPRQAALGSLRAGRMRGCGGGGSVLAKQAAWVSDSQIRCWAIDGVLDRRLCEDGGAESKRESRPPPLMDALEREILDSGHWAPDGLWCWTRLRGSLGRHRSGCGRRGVVPLRGTEGAGTVIYVQPYMCT